MKNLFTAMVLLVLCPCHTDAQVSFRKYLTVGDTIPDFHLPVTTTGVRSDFQFAKFQKKLLLLDFWGVNCGGCISAIPEMERLQKTFQDQLQVIMVTQNDAKKVQGLRDRVQVFRNCSLPVSVADSFLSPLFAITSFPSHVWIDSAGIVRQVTSGYNTNETVLADYFAGKDVHLAIKNEDRDFEFGKPLWEEGGGRQIKHFEYYSVLAKHIEGLGGLNDVGQETDPETKLITRIYLSNKPLLDILRMAYGGYNKTMGFIYYDTRVVFENAAYLDWPEDKSLKDAFKEQWFYSYDIKVPPAKSKEIFLMMQDDLLRYFNLSARIEKRKVKCLVLTRVAEKKLLCSNGTPLWHTDEFSGRLTMKNYSFKMVSNLIESSFYKLKIPFIDETGFTAAVDMQLPYPFDSIDALHASLNIYGFDLTEEWRDIDMFIVRDNSAK